MADEVNKKSSSQWKSYTVNTLPPRFDLAPEFGYLTLDQLPGPIANPALAFKLLGQLNKWRPLEIAARAELAGGKCHTASSETVRAASGKEPLATSANMPVLTVGHGQAQSSAQQALSGTGVTSADDSSCSPAQRAALAKFEQVARTMQEDEEVARRMQEEEETASKQHAEFMQETASKQHAEFMQE